MQRALTSQRTLLDFVTFGQNRQGLPLFLELIITGLDVSEILQQLVSKNNSLGFFTARLINLVFELIDLG